MTESPMPPARDDRTEAGEHARPPTADPAQAAHDAFNRWLYALLAIFLLALAFGAWGAWRTFAPGVDDPQAQLRAQQAKLEELEQRVATLTRSDQISREANRDLQNALAERDEEISGLRADVAFYERFVGATGQRRGLTVHELSLQPQANDAWHFTTTLTQNLNRGAVSSGRLTLAVEGRRNGRLETLSWAQLRQQLDAPGSEYSFKYFQQIEGDIFLPPGFEPVRVSVRLVPGNGAPVERSFPWAEATTRSGNGA